METKVIKSHNLSRLSREIKEDVNNGKMFLYGIQPDDSLMPKIAYVLYFGNNVYYLSKHGKLINNSYPEDKKWRIDSQIYFSDFPRPVSLSNYTEK
jgi:hypothetical protein